MRRKAVNDRGDLTEVVGSFSPDTYDSYASIWHHVDQSLVAVGGRLKKIFGREAKALQQRVHNALYKSAGGVKKLFVHTPEVVDRSLSLNITHSKVDESARPGSSYVHSANPATTETDKSCV